MIVFRAVLTYVLFPLTAAGVILGTAAGVLPIWVIISVMTVALLYAIIASVAGEVERMRREESQE